ncbi:MAG: ATP-binding protein [Elusimicrobia bacterium]|nr:ATP-binding protein [Elusimicrobiota bacterium]
MPWIRRAALEERLTRALKRSAVTLLLGPRQCGKTTLARRLAARGDAAIFDLEDPETPLTRETLALNLRDKRGLVVIDECQREPALFPFLRVLADRRPLPARFLLLGSASPELVRGVSESLAGRVTHVEMEGFTLGETGSKQISRLWRRGGLPPSYLASSEDDSYRWRLDFIRTHLERDLPALGIRVPAASLRRFWMMAAHLQGQTWNAAELARSMKTQEGTAQRYLDILTGSFMVRQLQPWFENLGKRLVKAPKIYFRDTGLLHALLRLANERELQTFPRLGFSWEGFAIEEVIRRLDADRDAYFYKTHGGAELDLMIVRGGRRYGFEMKYVDAPTATKSMHVALEDLRLERLWVIYPGSRAFPLSKKITALPLARLDSLTL